MTEYEIHYPSHDEIRKIQARADALRAETMALSLRRLARMLSTLPRLFVSRKPV